MHARKSSNNLISINRLPIPRNNESKPLVEYCSDNRCELIYYKFEIIEKTWTKKLITLINFQQKNKNLKINEIF